MKILFSVAFCVLLIVSFVVCLAASNTSVRYAMPLSMLTLAAHVVAGVAFYLGFARHVDREIASKPDGVAKLVGGGTVMFAIIAMAFMLVVGIVVYFG